MLRFIIQTTRKYKIKKELGENDIRDDETSEDTQEDEDSTHDDYDQDSSVSLDDDSTASKEDDTEDSIEYTKRSAKEADEKMLIFNITNWVETQKKLKWRQALRIAAQSSDRWTRKSR